MRFHKDDFYEARNMIEQITGKKSVHFLVDETRQGWMIPCVPHPERISLMSRFNGYFVWSVNPAGHHLGKWKNVCGLWVAIYWTRGRGSRLNPTSIASINRPSTSPQHVEMKQLGSREAPPLPRALQGYESFEANASPS